MSWYGQGEDNQVRKDEKARQEAKYGPERVWLKPGSKINTVFLDDVTFDYREWQFRKGGGWRGNHITDPGPEVEERNQVVAELGEPTMISMLTVIDLDGWISQKGDTKGKTMDQFRLMMLPLKSRGRKKVDMKREARASEGGLVFRKCLIMRTDDKAANSGDDFEFGEKVTDLDKMFEVAQYKGKKLPELWDLAEKDEEQMKRLKRLFQVRHEDDDESKPLIREVVPFNYYEVLKPLDGPQMLERIAGHTTPTDDDRGSRSASSSNSGGGSQPKADEVPF